MQKYVIVDYQDFTPMTEAFQRLGYRVPPRRCDAGNPARSVQIQVRRLLLRAHLRRALSGDAQKATILRTIGASSGGHGDRLLVPGRLAELRRAKSTHSGQPHQPELPRGLR